MTADESFEGYLATCSVTCSWTWDCKNSKGERMRQSSIHVTEAARLACPSLPDGDSLQTFKNWIFEKVRADNLCESLAEGVGQVIAFACEVTK